jgi:outer membrane protein assembly factor BamA
MEILRKNIILFLLLLLTGISNNIFPQMILEVDEVNFKFKGKRSFDDGQLEDAVAISKANVYKKEVVAEDILKLKKFYFDNGFFETEIDTAISLNYEDEEATITFLITENKRYKIDSVIIKGIENVPQETLAKINKIKTVKPGDNYSKVLIIQQENEILDTLQNSGYMNASLPLDKGTIITRYKNEGLVKVEIQIERADTILYFGSTTIDIKDNFYGVRTEYPRDEIIYKEGEIYSKAKKLDSERNMSKISIISSAKLNPSNISGNRVDFTADINLNKKNELTPYIKGSNFENRFYLGGGIRYLNKYFLQGNRSLVLELEEDFNSSDINLTQLSAAVTQPHFIARQITFINKLSIGFNNVENYKNYFIGNATTLNYFIATHTFYNNAYLDLTEELIWIKYDTIATGRQTQFNSFLSFTLEHDNTNNVLDPSRGFYHSIMAGHSGLLPRVITGIIGKNVFYSQFFKTYMLNKFYFNLSQTQGHTVFAASLKIGDIIEYGSGVNVIPVQPIYKFFSGGSSSVRGWSAKKNGMVANKILGGTFLFEGSLELRKKLFPDNLGFTRNIGAAFFIDYGNVWDSHNEFKFNQIALAVGFGIRYDLFIGPVRVDFGFKLYDPSQKDGEKWLFDDFTNNKLAIHFGIGQAF